MIKVSPEYTCRRKRPKMLFTAVSSALQIDLTMALTANPRVQGRAVLDVKTFNKHKLMIKLS